MSNLTKLYQIQEIVNETLHKFSPTRIELNEYIETQIAIEKEYED